MKSRVLVIAAGLVFLGLVLAPTTTAQAPSTYVKAKLTWAHGEMTVPDTGRADMPLEVTLEASGFVCAPPGPCAVSVELKLDSFAKWAGSSLEPFTAHFTIPANAPGAGAATYTATEDIKLNLAWDLETAPKTNAKQVYVVSTGAYKIEGSTAPLNVQQQSAKSEPMTATLPDRPETANGTSGAVDCAQDPFAPACATLQTSAPAESPAIDTGILLASLAVFAMVFRRRRA